MRPRILWTAVWERFDGGETVALIADGAPMLFVFDACRDFIRTVPVLRSDAMRPDDLDTQGEDHIVDVVRQACSPRPMIARPRRAELSPSPWLAPGRDGRSRRRPSGARSRVR